MSEKVYALKEATKNDLNEVRRRVLGTRGSERGPVFAPAAPIDEPARGDSGRWFRIASATQDGTNYRWTFTCKRTRKATPGYGGWSDHATDTADYTVYNGVDNPNGSTGTFGNGIAAANLGSYAPVPLGAGAIVHAISVTVESNGAREWWIDRVIQVDGACA
jgi:hypothetical protein